MKSKKPGSNQIVRRRLRILDMMSPTRKKTRAIFDALNDEGIEVKNIKTVQDDLQSLRDDFPNIVEARDEGGYFTYKKPSQDFINKRKSSSMSPQEAVCFQIAFTYLNPLLPSKSLDDLDPYLREAEAVLSDSSAVRMRNWKNKVLTMNEGLQLKQASIKKNVLKNVHKALWEEKTILAKYTSKNKTFPSKYIIHPAGLVYRGRICYLICSFENNNEKIIYLPLHRFQSIELNDDHYSRHRNHKVKSLAKDLIGFKLSEKEIKIKLKFSKASGSHLYETPLSSSQKISVSRDGFLIVEDTLTNDMELRFWIRAFGDSVEVLKPVKLRNEFKTIAKRMSKLYE
jgi:predicted DNA-binding transcriptional regulator YafY|tara:strand:+ start:2172 stop:3197 length:1026 start_codon:yes stop_codon:yes gene_type:complete